MRRGLNRVELIGHLGSDAIPGKQPNQPVKLTVATNSVWKDPEGKEKSATEWHKVVCWGGLRTLAPSLTKGRQVYIDGSLQTRSWDDETGNRRYVTEIVAKSVIILDPRKHETTDAADVDEDLEFPPAETAE